jgi:hypothetical protein
MFSGLSYILALGALAITLAIALAFSASAFANKTADQYFTAAASEKHGVRGYFKTVIPDVHGWQDNFSSSVAWIADEPSEPVPEVEVGFIKGYNAWSAVSSPAFYIAYCDSADWLNDFVIWVDSGHYINLGSVGSLHKYAVSRTAHNNDNGQSKWVWYFDGQAEMTLWLDAPDQGHPQAGGETYESNGTWPNMNAQGRNNGTSSDSCYWCFKNSSDVWYRWDQSHAANTDTRHEGSGVSISESSPKWTHFDASGQ